MSSYITEAAIRALEAQRSAADLHRSGIKDDGGKPEVGTLMLFCSRALIAMAKVADHGSRKYVPGGWLSVPNGIKRYTDAMQRHFLAEGHEEFDEEGLLHAAQVAVNAVYRLELMLREKASSDKPTEGEAK